MRNRGSHDLFATLSSLDLMIYPELRICHCIKRLEEGREIKHVFGDKIISASYHPKRRSLEPR